MMQARNRELEILFSMFAGKKPKKGKFTTIPVNTEIPKHLRRKRT